MAKTSQQGVVKESRTDIRILGNSVDNKYPLVPLLKIHIVERPEEGSESNQLFYNPRDLESMDGEAMTSLRSSIKDTGLHTPLIVRAITSDGQDGSPIVHLDLVAGERRLRSLLRLYNDNPMVYDWRTKTQKSAREVYEYVPCELCYNISDEAALSLAWIENAEHQPLTIQEEMNLVERLIRRGLKQDEIASRLNTNVTWVSQTCSFRRELPPEGLKLLLEGKLSRHVAVQILSFHKKDRAALLAEAIRIEKEESAVEKNKAAEAVIAAEDEETIVQAQVANTPKKSPKSVQLKKRLAAASRKVSEAVTKKERVDSEVGTIRQGHIQRGAIAAEVTPRTAKVLTRQMIDQFLVGLPQKWIEIGKVDQLVKKPYPPQLLKVVIATANAVLTGNIDTGGIVRRVLVEEGIWEMPEGVQEKTPELLEIADGDEED